jgi:hypothetical protein
VRSILVFTRVLIFFFDLQHSFATKQTVNLLNRSDTDLVPANLALVHFDTDAYAREISQLRRLVASDTADIGFLSRFSCWSGA